MCIGMEGGVWMWDRVKIKLELGANIGTWTGYSEKSVEMMEVSGMN